MPPVTTPVKWRPRTLRDAMPERAKRAEVREALATARAEVDNPTVTCACGRRTSADMCLDVRDLPPAVRRKFRHAHPFPCDGCVQRAMLEAGLTAEELATGLGAPPEVIARATTPRPVHG